MGAIETGHVNTELAREWRPSDVVVTLGRSFGADFSACVSGSVDLHALPDLSGHTVWVFVVPSQLTPVLQHYVRCKHSEVSSTSAYVLAPTTANTVHLQNMRCIAVFRKQRLCAGAAPFAEEHALWTDQFIATIDRVISPLLRQLKMQFAGKTCGVAGRVLLDSGAADSYLSYAFTTANNIPIVASPGYAVATSLQMAPLSPTTCCCRLPLLAVPELQGTVLGC